MEGSQTRQTRHLKWMLLIAVVVFLIVWLVIGKIFDVMNNATCPFPFGCNAGFFGYDGVVVHLVGGAMEALYIFWITTKHPRLSPFHQPFHENWKKNLLVMVAIIALAGVCWEFYELFFDWIRTTAFHMNLMVPVNRQAQPTNSDTLGDIFFGMLGGAITFLCFKISNFFA